MRYYISDLHYFHRNIDVMDHRGFDSLFQMHEYMISQWNKKVTCDDDVYILGDFSFGKGVETWNILTKLNGRKHLIEGNHDHYFLDDPEFVDVVLDDILSYDELVDDGRKVILSHYPMPFYNHQFRTNKEGVPATYMLYGHIHNTYDEYILQRLIDNSSNLEREAPDGGTETTPFQMINTFCVFSDYQPLSLNEWIELDNKRREKVKQFEKEQGGMINYKQWMILNDEIIAETKGKF